MKNIIKETMKNKPDLFWTLVFAFIDISFLIMLMFRTR